VRALPNDTEAMRDLSIVYGMRGTFLAEWGRLDSALAVYGRGMKIAEDLAAADPDNVLQQADVAAGHYEIGTMLLNGQRLQAARDRFREAAARYARLAAADSANMEHALNVARSYRRTGEACIALAEVTNSTSERARWGNEATDWLDRSLTRFQAMLKAGMLQGADTTAPAEIRQQLAALRR